MRVVFLYNESCEDPSQSAEEADPTRSPIIAVLQRLGHHVTAISCTLDLSAARRELLRAKPDVVLNRVESLGGSDAMMGAVPLLLETMRIPFTGCTGDALAATADKLTVKRRLVRAGLPTPAWVTADGMASSASMNGCRRFPSYSSFIIKSALEHASFRLDDSAVIKPATADQLAAAVREREAATGRPFFAEQFVDGREFNLSVWGNESQVLPPAEIDFSAFPANKPQIVAHGAKWDASSFEYHHTPRRFDFPTSDAPLLRQLCDLARQCSHLFNLQGGYARIDFRCDADDQPWVLEVNSNPCLSPDAGFVAALEQAGIGFDEAIERLLEDALARESRPRSLCQTSDSSNRVPGV